MRDRMDRTDRLWHRVAFAGYSMEHSFIFMSIAGILSSFRLLISGWFMARV